MAAIIDLFSINLHQGHLVMSTKDNSINGYYICHNKIDKMLANTLFCWPWCWPSSYECLL